MTTSIKTQSEFYDIYKNEVQSLAPEFTDFSEGSIHDIIAGALSIAINEVSELVVYEFSKTFFDLAEGSDLDRLAVDHFGQTFARPNGSEASGIANFSRLVNSGSVIIPDGTIVKTKKDVNGKEIRYKTVGNVTMTGLSINASIVCTEIGVNGNVLSGKITVIESALTDPNIVVTNSLQLAGGKEQLTDAEYRDFLRSKILSLAGATEAAIRGAALTVDGVEIVALSTRERVVIDYDIALDQILSGATYFRIPYSTVYVADANGNSSPQMIADVEAAIFLVKACGVDIEVRGASPISINWTASITLNAGGPNYSELQSDLTKIKETMAEYINEKLLIGQGFNKTTANNYVLSVWGPSGTNDITSFSSSVPSGNVSVLANEKLIAGTMVVS
jgi:hypothetical protein